MADATKSSAGPENDRDAARKARQAAALRANLRRRKDQKRGRDEAQAEVETPPGDEQ